ncbi:DegT/DnrJ/EryC1/StrS family aminotransferase [Magnetospirillum aberrantis]|uniref:DegT/DnrJ/EryC1/StrS family aminotransferase n=1 Tax=Magnetospirillum aberrantis SpK TaxID=908842 RepID=A0A7C9QT77_9PROT|nr:DegT/DnrJ/EryC1/StrS family aminotransferase [Magnetospirillum aberrantis]NFV79717.1 DegT/DnrJ/EryC1/StrS family aminotransferase [Magnetospirillum aberrantis SpK]
MIPFLDLRRQYDQVRDDIEAAVKGVLDSGQFILGPAVQRFEGDFARYCRTEHAVAVSSGTAALHLALLAAGVEPGDEVITVPMTFVATVAAILYAGARPVFVDVDESTWTMDAAQLETAITPRTKAILPVHLHGLMADMEPILAIAARRGIAVIEDAAQAHGAEYREKRAGSMGRLGCFSFYPGKNLGACGEGGAVVTDDPALAERVRVLRDWGQVRKYEHLFQGFNYRMDGIQGAILGVKLRHIEDWTEGRRRAAAGYDRNLGAIRRPSPPDHCRHVYHVYAVRVVDRDRVRAELDQAGIGTGIHYPVPVHLQPAYAGLGYRAGDFPVSERIAAETLSLPMFPELEDGQVEEVCRAVIRAVDGGEG